LKKQILLMKKLLSFLLLTVVCFNACKKGVEMQENSGDPKITNNLNQFKDLKVPSTSRSDENGIAKAGSVRVNAIDNSGCSTILHKQSAEFDKLSVLDPSGNIMYAGSLIDGESIQNGTYKPLFLPGDYVRKPITYSVSIQGSNGAISKTINPDLASFRVSMQEIMSANIVGQQPANFTFELVHARSKREIEMKIGANLKIGSFFSSVANFDESALSTKSFYLLKIYQKFFSADINIPADGNLFNKPTNFEGTVAPVYISSIDYGRSAYLLIESSYDSTRVYKSIEASFSVWKIGGGGSLSKEHKEVMDNMKLSGTIIGGSSSDAAKAIEGIPAFRDYVINGGNMGPDSRGEVIAYTLRNAKDHGIYKTIINGDYYMTDCSSQLVNVNSFVAPQHHYLSTGMVDDWRYWRYEGVVFRAYNKQVSGTVPINVYFSEGGRDHYYTMGTLNDFNYWRYEGVAFYAYPTQVPGSVPIYIHYSTGGRDHYYSQSSNLNDPRYWDDFQGVGFYAMP